jgi:hypothetical protein
LDVFSQASPAHDHQKLTTTTEQRLRTLVRYGRAFVYNVGIAQALQIQPALNLYHCCDHQSPSDNRTTKPG